MVPNVVLTSVNAGYLYLSFLNLHFTCLFLRNCFVFIYLCSFSVISKV